VYSLLFIFIPRFAPVECSEVNNAVLIPQAGSLGIELFFYIAMALVLARSRRLVLLWFATSLVYPAYMIASGDLDNAYNFCDRYVLVWGGSLPFSLGATVFYHKDLLSKIPRWHIAPASALFALSFVATEVYVVDPDLGWLHQPLLRQIYQVVWSPVFGGLYISFLMGTYLLACLSSVGKGDAPGWLVRTDRFLGDLSYPIFLCHFTVGLVVAWVTRMSWSPALFFVTFIFTNLAAWVIYILVEERIATARMKVRKRAERVLKKSRSPEYDPPSMKAHCSGS
jgi:peptidoglycan/LPS O-acetylase OafA/YrhL